jgi:hypothetical protein
VEQVGQAPASNLKCKGKKGGIGLCKSHPAIVLRDVTPRLRLVGCSLWVVWRLLLDVGRIPGDLERVRQEVGHILFAVSLSLPSFAFLLSRGRKKGELLLPRGISRILFSYLRYEGKE